MGRVGNNCVVASLILSKMAPGWTAFFAYKKYSHSFVKLQLNHWCHMNYFNDVLTMFLGLDRVKILAVYGRVIPSDLITNIVICVLKINEGLTGLERHEGEQLITVFIFGWTIPLMLLHQEVQVLGITLKCFQYNTTFQNKFKHWLPSLVQLHFFHIFM